MICNNYYVQVESKIIARKIVLFACDAQPELVGLITLFSKRKDIARVAGVKICPVPRLFCDAPSHAEIK